MATDLIGEEARSWIGRSEPIPPVEISRREIIKYSIATQQRVAKYVRGDEAPPMFFFGVFRPVVDLEDLSSDGLAPATLLPELSLKRVMAGGTKIRYHRPVRPGDVLVGERTLVDMVEKQGRTGPLIFVDYELRVTTDDGEPVLDERLTQILR